MPFLWEGHWLQLFISFENNALLRTDKEYGVYLIFAVLHIILEYLCTLSSYSHILFPDCLPFFVQFLSHFSLNLVACSDDFDVQNLQQCQKATWTQRYYFDRRVKRCQMFWYDASCEKQATLRKINSRNFFSQLITCQLMCESKVKQISQTEQPQQRSAVRHRHSSIGSDGSPIGMISASFTDNIHDGQKVIPEQGYHSEVSSGNRSSSSQIEPPRMQKTHPKHNQFDWHPPAIGKITASFSAKKTQERKENSIPLHIGVISASFSVC